MKDKIIQISKRPRSGSLERRLIKITTLHRLGVEFRSILIPARREFNSEKRMRKARNTFPYSIELLRDRDEIKFATGGMLLARVLSSAKAILV